MPAPHAEVLEALATEAGASKAYYMAKENEYLGTIEEVVRDARKVEKGAGEFNKMAGNAPSHPPSRREFFKHVAVLAGLYASGQLLKGYAIAQEPVQFQGKSYSGWEAWLMSQDWIRGPSINQGWNYGHDGVDYGLEIGIPITPTANSYSSFLANERRGGKVLHLFHRNPFTIQSMRIWTSMLILFMRESPILEEHAHL